MLAKKQAWKGQKEAFEQSLQYLKGRMLGQIRSLKTPWTKFNDATTNGIEWHTMTVIAGRPGAGKTLVKDQIIRESFVLNTGEDFRVLEFQLEMLARASAIREYSSVLGRSYKYLCSADGQLKIEDLKSCVEYAKLRVKYPIDVVEEAPTVLEFKQIVHDYMEAYSTIQVIRNAKTGLDESIKIYKKTIVTIDHSLLVKKGMGEKDKQDMLSNLGEAITELKRKYPIAFIILSQLNRAIDNPDRNEDGQYGNYVLESDIFGSDALLQHSDTVVGLNRPGKQKIRYYGPDRYFIENDKVLVFHFLKCRNGDVGISFFKAEFEKMSISEMQTPPTQERRMKTSM